MRRESTGKAMSAGRPGTLGIMREAYSKWERRAPLTPTHVARLVEQGIRVHVQPCDRRVFSNVEYEKAGAVLRDDLGEAAAILGVKQVPIHELLPNRAYMFFSHTIKAQPENMALLDAVRQQQIRLFDYECITEGGERGAPRTVAFGSFAGMAGMIGGVRGLGERALNLGYHTPFLSAGSAYMYPDLASAEDAVRAVGAGIASAGLPQSLAPFNFVFTGDGAASKGAQEIFKLMPHTMVEPHELPHLPADPYQVFGCVVKAKDMVQHSAGAPFDYADYLANPHAYSPNFHQVILPNTSAVVHCSYWEPKYPRLLTKEQLLQMRRSGNEKLLGVVDISCDIGGAFEMLTHSTHPELPYYVYDPELDKSSSSLDTDGLLMCGVDILPSELPREASAHFGDKLLAGGFAASLACLDPAVAWSQAQSTLPVELRAACIAADGELNERWKYIEEMRIANDRNAAVAAGGSKVHGAEELEGSTVVELSGHLFDSGLLNGVLDLIEQHGAMFAIVDMNVRPNAAEAAYASTAHLQISASGGRAGLEQLLSAVEEMVKSTGEADATLFERQDYCGDDYGLTLNVATATSTTRKPVPSRSASSVNKSEDEGETVLVLGAGLVARPAVELLSRCGSRKVLLVSGVDGEAAALADKLGRSNVVPITMDCSDVAALRPHVASSSAVLSLLPATMHQDVALASIDTGVPLVTASYVSDELRALQSRAAAAGVPVLGEMGLDPGMDHMSAMEMIDAAAAAGASVRSFRSVCGGLPAPEAANNMLRYKFSWSPRGVLSAASNDARWLENGQVMDVRGSQLLAHSSPTNAVPTLNLEVLPNRNSLPYKEAYRLHDADTVYRGTLRFGGFCDRVLGLQQMGLLSSEVLKEPMESFSELFAPHEAEASFQPEQRECIAWLRAQAALLEPSNGPYPTKLDALTAALESIPVLQFGEHERDMCVLQHELEITWTEQAAREAGLTWLGAENSRGLMLERRVSRMIAFGSEEKDGDTAMAQTVGLTAAAGVELMLSAQRPRGGVHIPTEAAVYKPVLQTLAGEGLGFQEESVYSAV